MRLTTQLTCHEAGETFYPDNTNCRRGQVQRLVQRLSRKSTHRDEEQRSPTYPTGENKPPHAVQGFFGFRLFVNPPWRGKEPRHCEPRASKTTGKGITVGRNPKKADGLPITDPCLMVPSVLKADQTIKHHESDQNTHSGSCEDCRPDDKQPHDFCPQRSGFPRRRTSVYPDGNVNFMFIPR